VLNRHGQWITPIALCMIDDCSRLVTFNVDDFAPARRFNRPLLTPAVFLRRLNQEKT